MDGSPIEVSKPIVSAFQATNPNDPNAGNPNTERMQNIDIGQRFFISWHQRSLVIKENASAHLADTAELVPDDLAIVVAEAEAPEAEVAAAPAAPQVTTWPIAYKPSPSQSTAPNVQSRSIGGRPTSGQSSHGGLGARHTVAISIKPSRKGAAATKAERKEIRVADLQSRVKLQRSKAEKAAIGAERNRDEYEDVPDEIKYLYDKSTGRILWGKGEAAPHMLLALERAWSFLESGSVPDHPEMTNLRKVCRHTLGLSAWSAFYKRVKHKIDVDAVPQDC